MNNGKPILFALLLVLGIVAQLATRPWTTPIAWDGFGYYLYLPLTFVHNDLGMQDPSTIQGIFDAYHPSGTFYQAHRAPTGNMVIRYTPGLALLNLPGFLLAHAVAQALGYPADGLSLPYQIAAAATGLFFLFIGLLATLKVLLRFFGALPAYLSTAVMLYGTNLMDQAVEQLLMTHLYSFALFALLLLATARLHEKISLAMAVVCGAILGLLVLVRPPNALAIILPVLWPLGDMRPLEKIKWLWRKQRAALCAFGMAAIPPVLLLLGYWKLYAGSWFYDSYQNPGEGLDIFYPHLHKFLFSFRKGWFIYTPIMLLALAGLLFGLKGRLKRIKLPLLLFLAVHLYVVSSWTLWYYPGGFGQRAAVDIYALMAIGCAAAIAWALEGHALRRVPFFMGMATLVLLVQFQILQQRRGVWPPNRMTAAYYKATFLDVHPDPAKQHLLLFDRPTTETNELPLGLVPAANAVWQQPMALATSVAPDGSRAFLLDTGSAFSPAFDLPYDQLTRGDHAWIVVSGMLWMADSTAQGSIVVHMDHGGAYGYKALDLERLNGPAGKWIPFEVVYLTPEPRRTYDPVKTYAWYRGGGRFWMKDLTIRQYVEKEYTGPGS